MNDSSQHRSGRQALVIDDSRTTRRLMSAILRELGFEVSEAADGREGLERLRALGESTLVLVDWNMPKLDGLSFVREVRADPAYQHVLLMMVTTEVQMAKVAHALSAGANEYLMKPFTKDMVAEKLALLGIATEHPRSAACGCSWSTIRWWHARP